MRAEILGINRKELCWREQEIGEEADETLRGLNFEAKKAIISKADMKRFSPQRDLMAHCFINLSEIHVALFSKYRNSRFAKRRKINPF